MNLSSKIILCSSVVLLGFSAQAGSRLVDPMDPPPTDVTSSSPIVSSLIAPLTVQDLLFIPRLEEVRKIFARICWKERDAYTANGRFTSLPETLGSIPHVEPEPVNAPQWEAFGIFPPGTSLLFRYRVEATGVGQNATYTVTAEGDQDGDSITSLFFMQGYVMNRLGWPICSDIDGKNPLE